jgi:carbon storage regulator
MLILTRRPGESIYVGDAIRITVLSLQGKNVRIGLEVPEDTVVYREEVYVRVSEENRMALKINTEDLMTAAQIWKGRQSKS